MRRRPFVVLDRDGTIIVERHYLSDPRQIELIPGAAKSLRQLSEAGLGLIVITNQSALRRGFIDLPRLQLIHRGLCELLAAEGVHLNGIYFCPHTPEEDCLCRKPRPGLLAVAAKDLDFDPQASFVIGDKACDIELGQRVGATTFLVRTGYGAQVATDTRVMPDYVVDDVGVAAQVIQRLLSADARTAFEGSTAESSHGPREVHEYCPRQADASPALTVELDIHSLGLGLGAETRGD